jgi:signal peptide peptidase SppA
MLDLAAPPPDASRFVGEVQRRDGAYFRAAEGVGIISIVGSLAHRGAYVGASSGVVSYEGIKQQLKAVRDDPKVKAVLLDIESPGGEAIGAMETAAMVRDLRDIKPVTAVVNGMAASAGYAIASGASKIVTIESGISGSIGVVLLHVDFSQNLAEEGIKPTLIHAGAHKVDGNPFEPLSDRVTKSLQADVNTFYDQFVATVAAGRPGLASDAIRDTQADTFIGAQAIEAGLADDVGSFETALSDLISSAQSRARQGGTSMSNTTGTPEAENTGNQDQQIADAKAAGYAEGLDKGQADGAAEAKSRIQSILALESAKGREKQALSLALNTSSTAQEADDVLKDSPAASAENSFTSAMRQEDDLDIGNGGASAESDNVVALDQRMADRF